MTASREASAPAATRPDRPISTARRLADLVVLVRLPSCLAGGASVLLGIHLTTGGSWHGRAVWLGVLSMFFAVAAANAVNDVLDAGTDAVGKPSRPLPAGRLAIRSALAISGAASVASILSAAPLGAYAVLWTIILLAVAFLYSYRLKNIMLLGNAVVAVCASSPILFGAFFGGRPGYLAWTGAGLSFIFMFAYETLKTIADRDSDAESGIRTFAARVGVRPAVLLLRGVLALLTAVACAATAITPHPVLYLITILVTFVVPAWSAIAVLGTSPGHKQIKSSVLLMRSAWFLGIIALWMLH